MLVLFIQLGRIGDMILDSSVFKAVKQKHPDSSIAIICSKHNYPIIESNPFIDEVYIYDKSFLRTLKLIKVLRKKVYDYYIDFKDHKSNESNIFARIIKAKVKIGYNSTNSNVFDINVKDYVKVDIHHARKAIITTALSGLINIDEDYSSDLHKKPIDEQRFEQFRRINNIDKYILINSVGTSEARKLSIDKQKQIVEYLLNKNYKIIFTKVNKSENNPLLSSGNVFEYFTNTINELFPVVEHAELIITPDTSIVHIGAAYSKRMLALYVNDEVNFRKFAPLSDDAKVLFSKEGGSSINNIPNDEIISSLEVLLK
jgi:ADP-heptose:LPS heptosyltransferase